MPEYTTLARIEDVPPGAIYETEFDGRPLLIVNDDGAVRVIDALCTHLEGPLSQGELIDGAITCPWHNSAFDLASGEATKKPASVPIGVHDVQIEDGEIRVAIAVEIADDDRVRRDARCVGHARFERPVAMIEEHADVVRVEARDGEIGITVAIEIAGANGYGKAACLVEYVG